MTTEMDQTTAQHLFHHGATFVFLDVPSGTEFGIDYNSWTVGTKFRGVKMIPPGIHFIYYSAVGKEGSQASPRIGFYHNFTPKEVLVKKWNKQMEDIETDNVSTCEQERIEASKMELDRYLGVYPYDSYKKWVSLTDCMTAELVETLQPENIKIYSACQLVSEGSTTQSRALARSQLADGASSNDASADNMKPAGSTELDDPRLPNMAAVEGSTLRLRHIPKQKHPPGATPDEISRHNMDHSYILETLLINDEYDILLGELQFTFLCFLLGQVYDAFEHWKKLVSLLCTCEEAITKHPRLYDKFMTVLHFHLKEIPEDFFVDIISQNNFLTVTLSAFFSNVRESDADVSLRNKARRFREHLEKKFSWDFTQFEDDEDPIVVV